MARYHHLTILTAAIWAATEKCHHRKAPYTTTIVITAW
jgi:hypothetical protein